MTELRHLNGGYWRRRSRSDLIPTGLTKIRPSAATTGVPAGTVLTENRPANGQLAITTAGTVLDGLDIYGQVYVQAANVTIRRCRIRGRNATTNESLIQATSASVSSLLVEDCTLRPDFPSYWLNGFLGSNFTVRRCDISRCVDGFGVYNTNAPGTPLNVTIESNYVHDFSYYSPDPNHTNDNQTHNDGIQIQGGTGAIIRYNLIDSYFATDVGTGNQTLPRALSCILFNVNVGTTGGHVIEDNWLYGGQVPVNGIGTPNVDLGRMWRNEFSGDTTGTPPQTIQVANNTVIDIGAGTVNKNTFRDTATDILLRRSA